MYALFKGKTQLARTFASEQEVLNAALAEGLVPELQVTDEAGNRRLPADYYIKVVEKTYDPQPDVSPIRKPHDPYQPAGIRMVHGQPRK